MDEDVQLMDFTHTGLDPIRIYTLVGKHFTQALIASLGTNMQEWHPLAQFVKPLAWMLFLGLGLV